MKKILLTLAFISAYAQADTTIYTQGQNPYTTPADTRTPITAVTKYVDCTQGTNGNGTFALPYNNWAAVTASAPNVGVDALQKEGTTCSQQRIVVNWSGTSVDPVYIGTYYVLNGQPYKGVSDPGELYNPMKIRFGTQAIVTGTYNSTCRSTAPVAPQTGANNCLWNQTGAIPLNNQGLVDVGNVTNVIIENLNVRDAAGIGIYLHPNQGVVTNNIVQDNIVYRIASTGIVSIFGEQVIIRRNLVEHTNIDWTDNKQPLWGVAILARGTVLVERNLSMNIWGECYGDYAGFDATDITVWRGNRCTNHRRLFYYDAASPMMMVEQAINVGGAIDTLGAECRYSPNCTPSYVPRNFDVGNEGTGSLDSQAMVVRNSFTASPLASCDYQAQDAALPAGNTTSAWIYGNTCINTLSTGDYQTQQDLTLAGHVGTIEHANNFYAGASGVANTVCRFVGVNNLFRNNYYQFAPSDTNCKGTGDVVGGTTGLGSFNFATASGLNNFPNYPDFMLTNPSSANSGVPRNNIIPMLNTAKGQWLHSQFQWQPCGRANLSFAQWIQGLYADFCNTPRSTTAPDPGAIETP